MNRRGFLQALFGVSAGAAALASGIAPASALPAAPLAPLANGPAPAAAILHEEDLAAAAPEKARWVYVRRRRFYRRRVYYRRRRYYPVYRRRRYYRIY